MIASQRKHQTSSKRSLEQAFEDDNQNDDRRKVVRTNGSYEAIFYVSSPPEMLHNPYEGNPAALQLSETIQDFHERLKPSSIDCRYLWIWCANFRTSFRESDEDIAGFRQTGTRLLEAFQDKRRALETSFDPPKTIAVITRMLSAARRQLEQDILRTARKHKVITGKWMLFPPKAEIDKQWRIVVDSTTNGHRELPYSLPSQH